MNSSIPLEPASCTPLANLSVEIFAIIVEFLDIRGIQSLRLAGRNLYFLSSPYLFRTVTFAPHQEDLDRLEKISQDELLSHNTHILRYDTAIMRLPGVPDDLDKIEFQDYFSQVEWRRIPRDSLLHYSRPSIQSKAMVGYTKFVNEQDIILKHLQKHLERVLAAFPKLFTITICNSYGSKSLRFKHALRENSISRKLVRTNQFHALFRAIANTPECSIRKIDVQGYQSFKPYKYLDNGNFGDDSDVPGSIKYCLGSTFTTARYPKGNIPFIYGSAFAMTSEDVSMTQAIFSNLTHLSMGIFTAVAIEDFYIDPVDVPKTYWGEFPSILLSLKNVVDLSLDMKIRRSIDQQHACSYYHDDLQELFGGLQLQRLERLKLSQFRSCGSSVKEILLKQPKLRDLSLNFIIEIQTGHDAWGGNSWIPNPHWIHCIKVMRGLKLRRLHLKGIEGFGHCFERYGSENEDLTLSRIHDYILYGYGDMPLSNRTPDGSHRLPWDAEASGMAWDAELW